MDILALESYYGGSHKAFLDGWVRQSRHKWDVITLPASKWKWRMRHSAVTFADDVRRRLVKGKRWDIIFCSDMLNLAEFLGLVGGRLGRVPAVVFFHENQLTYPNRFESERDYQFVMTNMTTALAAKAVWFNSAFHRDEFLEAMEKFLKRMPDNQPIDVIERVRDKSSIHPPGIDPIGSSRKNPDPNEPMHILWAARWEHDKNPEDFFEAMKLLKQKGCDFRLSVIGEQFREMPEIFEWAREFFAEHIDKWGYQSTRAEYESTLCRADVVVSTANHEFFGIGVVEAIAAGTLPILPKRLAYPEIIREMGLQDDEVFYDGSIDKLVEKLTGLIEAGQKGLHKDSPAARAGKFYWQNLAPVLDDALEGALL